MKQLRVKKSFQRAERRVKPKKISFLNGVNIISIKVFEKTYRINRKISSIARLDRITDDEQIEK